MTPSTDEPTQETTAPARKKARGKSRSFDFGAIEHVGNDATEGGFLGDDAAESERRGEAAQVAAPPVLTVDSESAEPSRSEAAEVTAVPVAQAAVQETTERSSAPVADGSTSLVPSPSQPPGENTTRAPAAPRTSSAGEPELRDERPALEEPTESQTTTERSTAPRRINDGPGFSATSAEPTLKPRPRKKAVGTKSPMREAVLASFIKHRTERNWPTWSGRIEGETKGRLLQKADEDALSSGRNLMPGHYLDAALRLVKDLEAEELAALANNWLIEKWSGEHPPGVSIQAGVSPDMYQLLKGLKRTLRGQRGAGSGGLILDVVSAAVDRFLDAADGEGSFPPAR
ncbi:hypothetical protein [Streptomyces scopuliridis]|uniref:hypothetical protein n=1 Tax=Streptomyces scopuliridis TaxID=452529 RepID=UPI0036967936